MSANAGDGLTAPAPALPETARAWHQRVWSLSWPVLLANLTIPLVGIVDTAVMGRMPEPAYIGAVAVGAAIFSSLYWLFGFLRMGTTGLAAQASGRGSHRELARVAARAAAVALAIGILVLLVHVPLGALMFALFDASEAVESLAATYYSIRIWGAPALMLHMVALGVLFGTQRMRATLLINLVLNITNVILDLLFVLGFGWGVGGVALATLFSEWLAAGLGLWFVLQGMRRSGFERIWLAALWTGRQARELFQVSGNLIVRSFFVQLPFFVFTVLGARFGDLVLAANAVLMQFFYLMAFGLDAFAHTAETLSGYAFGARNAPALRRAVRVSLIWAVGCAMLMAGAYGLLGGLLVDSLTTLADVRAAARGLLPWAVALPLLAVGAFHLDGVFIGTTRTAELRNSMFHATVLFGLTLLVALEPLGNHGLWLAMAVFLLSRTLLLAARYPRLERLAATL